ncbi:2Fe-2S iron-sulfur cluster-binding protein [Dactylosporangium sp. NPDC051484]|uniref:2Fe-2S iron-sulfur cluster-binding protein n=1 Tax=Dactylosporangium sp. NPDC051484 TaxID=3154942 RepID=UPI00344BBB41
MPKVTFVQADGASATYDFAVGKSLMLAAQSQGVDGILGECGGQAMCATCHVYVGEKYLEYLPEVSEEEDEMLGEAAAERRPNSRLSCQIRITEELDGLVLEVPEEQVS